MVEDISFTSFIGMILIIYSIIVNNCSEDPYELRLLSFNWNTQFKIRDQVLNNIVCIMKKVYPRAEGSEVADLNDCQYTFVSLPGTNTEDTN